MDEGRRRLAAEWFDRADRDLATATLLLDQNGFTDVIALHIQQAVEKALKGYLVLHDRPPPRTHDLDALLNLAAEFQPSIYDSFIEFCEKATAYYMEHRYPPGPVIDFARDEVQQDLDLARRLISMLDVGRP